MPMKNLDTLKQQLTDIQLRMHQALADNNADAFTTAWGELSQNLQETILTEARLMSQQQDTGILAARGVRQLTSQERGFYEQWIDAMRSPNPQQALTDLEVTFPPTIIDMVFADITEAHPLLDLVDFQNTGALTEILLSTTGGVAGWGELCDPITKELTANFVMVPLTSKKLSAYIPVCKAMLDLGPEWVDRYVRALLGEALAVEAEAGIVDGTGKGMPIGMDRKLSDAVDGAYPLKAPVVVTTFDPKTLGPILATIAKGPNNKARALTGLVLIVNPVDYYNKVFPATTIRATDGTYVNNVLPYPMRVVESAAVPENRAILGLPKRYFMGIGTSKGGTLEYSDHYKFLEDARTYLIKLYGNGRALHENDFVLLDITNLEPVDLRVYVTNAEEFPAV